MFVVTDESTTRIGRESSLSSTGETEEEGDVSIGTLVGRGVKRKVAEFDGLKVVLHDQGVCQCQANLKRERRKLTMTEKIPFFISPAYSVPRMTIS